MASTSPRTDYDSVQSIMEQTLDRKKTEAFISSANVMVTEHLSDQDLGETLLKEIETYLTAHLLSLTIYRQAEQKKIGDASEKYSSLGQGLKSTTYGQIVISLDSSGMLSNANKRIATIRVVPQFDDSDLL